MNVLDEPFVNWVVRPSRGAYCQGPRDRIRVSEPTESPGGGAAMAITMQTVLILGTHVSGIDVSVDRRGWQRERAYSVALDGFPTVNGTGVSARRCPA